MNGPLDILDHAAPRLGSGTKLGFDCTRKIPGEDIDGEPIAAPRERLTDAGRARAEAWARTIPGVLDAAAPGGAQGWLFVRADRGHDEPDRAGLGGKIIDELVEEPTATPFVVVLGRAADVGDPGAALFHWVANCDAARDAVWDRRHGGDRVLFDATPKSVADARNGQCVRAWPPEQRFDDQTLALIDRRWVEYGLADASASR